MKWMVTEDKLGPDQIEVIGQVGKIQEKPIWIRGHAGSGKSVVLLHALSDYIVRNPEADVCVVVFTRALVDLLEVGIEQIPGLSDNAIPVYTINQFNTAIDNGAEFDAIFCDEVQDLPLEFILSLRDSCQHLIIAGDENQSIYTSVPNFDEPPATVEEIRSDLVPLEIQLRMIYRLTDSVIEMLKNVFPDVFENAEGSERDDTDILLYGFDDDESEIKYCWSQIKKSNEMRPSDIFSVLFTGSDAVLKFVTIIAESEGIPNWSLSKNTFGKLNYGRLNNYFDQHNLPLMYVGNGYGSLSEAAEDNKIVLTTYYSAKGLDFDYVYLPFVNDPLPAKGNESQLMLVALSRSKNELWISYSGELSSDIAPFLEDIEVIDPFSIESDDNDDQLF